MPPRRLDHEEAGHLVGMDVAVEKVLAGVGGRRERDLFHRVGARDEVSGAQARRLGILAFEEVDVVRDGGVVGVADSYLRIGGRGELVLVVGDLLIRSRDLERGV